MKRIYSFLFAALLSTTLFAAETAFLPISVMAGDNVESFPAGAQALIENKLTQVLTRNGIAGLDYTGQFVLTVTTTPLDKDVIAGPPAKIAERMEMNLYIVDVLAKKVFASTSIKVRGLGETETKCYLNAISNMPLQSPELAKFIEEGKQKIIAYYDHETDNLIKQAQFLAKQKKYEEALSIVTIVPQQSAKYDAAMNCGLEIYQQYINNECNINLAKARQAWAAQQDAFGAAAAGEYLEKILPDAGCYGDAMALYKEIKGKVLDDWKFEMKLYQDDVDVKKLQINASKEVGVAYGKNQPKQNTTIEFLRGML